MSLASPTVTKAALGLAAFAVAYKATSRYLAASDEDGDADGDADAETKASIRRGGAGARGRHGERPSPFSTPSPRRGRAPTVVVRGLGLAKHRVRDKLNSLITYELAAHGGLSTGGGA